MNREIKFRAWDVANKRWIKSWMGDILNLRPVIGIHKIELSQYTGLLDKNGKEIYEGDIMRFNQGLGAGDFDYIVKWDEDLAGFDLGDDERFMNGSVTPRFYAVVGNIYENPELLPK